MTLPDLQACPNCDRSIKVRPKNCPGCGYAIRAYRIRVTIGDRTEIQEKVVAIPPQHLDKFEFADGLVEEIGPDDPRRCGALKRSGERCGNLRLVNYDGTLAQHCHWHGGIAELMTPGQTEDPTPLD